jgi:type I restriction enzyme S subunit
VSQLETSRFKTYSYFKESEVELLGKVPEEWQVYKLKHLSDVIPSNVDKHSLEGQKTVQLCNYVDVYKNELIKSSLEFMVATASDLQIEKLSLKINDVIITKDSEDPFDIGIPSFVEEDLDNVVCGYHLSLLRANPTVLDGKFLMRYLQSSFAKTYFYLSSNGITRFALGKDEIKSLPIAIPTVHEQKAISNFLDHETFKLDSLVSKKQRLIELLQEKRQAVITQAITKGLNPDVKMKDSGIDWLGEMPEHWKLKRSDAILDYRKENIKSKDLEGVKVFHYSIPSVQQFGDGQIEDGSEIDSDKILLRGDELLVSKLNPRKGTVILAQPNEELIVCSTEFVPLVSKYSSSIKYAYYLYSSHFIREQLNAKVQSATKSHQRANPSDITKIWVAVPPLEEQDIIVNHLDRAFKNIDTLIAKIHLQIDKIQEYRKALITAAVTGQIDVREEITV